MHLSQSVPQEVWEQILAHLVDDRDTLEAVIQADCAASAEAQRLYWMNSLAMKGLLEELDDEPGLQRQTLANYVRNIIMDFEAPDADHRSSDLHFPLVQKITVVHDQDEVHDTRVYAQVKRFVGPRMLDLEIGCETFEHLDLQAITDNFLPELSVCVGLRSLEIHARVKDATSGDLVLVLQGCNQLQTLHQ
jgi:hypothetical protein